MKKLFHMLLLALVIVSTTLPEENITETNQSREIISANESIKKNKQQRRDNVFVLKNENLQLISQLRNTLSAIIKNEKDGKHPDTFFQKLARVKVKHTKASTKEILNFLNTVNNHLENAHCLLQKINNTTLTLDEKENNIAQAHRIITQIVKQLHYAISYRFTKETLQITEIPQKNIDLFCIEKIEEEFKQNIHYINIFAQQIIQLTLTEVNRASRKISEKVDPYVPSKTKIVLTAVGAFALYYAYKKYYCEKNCNNVLKTKNIIKLYNNGNESLDTFLHICKIPTKICVGIASLVSVKSFVKKSFNKAKKYLSNKLLGNPQKQEAKNPYILYPTITFNDVFGMKKEKIILEELIDYLMDPEYTTSIGAIPGNLSYIFAGKTRSGKTHLIRAFVGELNARREQSGLKPYPLIFIKATSLLTEGASERFCTPTNLINDLRNSCGSCIAFIDEVDLLNLQRNKNNKLLSEFLDGLDQSTQDPTQPVILFTATNRVDKLDEALKQPGRFGKVIHFDYPSYQKRKQFIKKLLTDYLINADNIDLDLWAQRTHNTTFEDIIMWINNAKRLARTRNMPFDNKLLFYAYLTEIKGVELLKEQNISSEKNNMQCTYFAGQALACHILDTNKQINFVTTRICEVPQREAKSDSVGARTSKRVTRNGKLFTMLTSDTNDCLSIAQEINNIKVLLAGAAAQEIITGQPARTGWNTHDNKKIFKLCCKLSFDGLEHEKDIPEQIRTEKTNQALALKDELFTEVKELLEQHKNDLEKLTTALCQYKILMAAQVQEFLQS